MSALQALTPAQHAYWQAYCAQAQPADAGQRFYEAFYFGDSQPLADELAALVLAGVKRATAGLVWAYEAEGQQPPAVGALSLMTDWAGTPLGIIETTAVQIVPFEEVTAEFAATEGEGDQTLAWWRRAHWDFYGRECARIGRTPHARMLVACERFTLVHRATPMP